MISRTKWLLTLLTASACAPPSAATPDFCAVYRAVPTLACGSEAQKLAVDQDNAVYLELCRGGAP